MYFLVLDDRDPPEKMNDFEHLIIIVRSEVGQKSEFRVNFQNFIDHLEYLKHCNIVGISCPNILGTLNQLLGSFHFANGIGYPTVVRHWFLEIP